MRAGRASIALVAVVLATLFLSDYFHPYWIQAFLKGRTFEPTWGWFSLGWLTLTWGYDFLATLIASFVLALLLPRGARIWWYVALGISIAGLRWLSAGNLVPASTAGTAAHAVGWVYGTYVMSLLGAVVGGVFAVTFGHAARPSNDRWRSS
jgi:hypothetical protein